MDIGSAEALLLLGLLLTSMEAFLLGAVLSPTDRWSRPPSSRPSGCRGSSGTRSTSSPGSTTGSRSRSSSSSWPPGGHPGREAIELLGEAAVGAAIGVALALAAGRLPRTCPGEG